MEPIDDLNLSTTPPRPSADFVQSGKRSRRPSSPVDPTAFNPIRPTTVPPPKAPREADDD